jgi:hypothetical protein
VCVCVCLWCWGLNLGLHACSAGALPLEPHPLTFSCWLFLRQGLTLCLLFVLAHEVGMTGAHRHTRPLVEWDLTNFLPSWPRTTILLISVSHVARNTGLSHHTYSRLLYGYICDISWLSIKVA